MKKIILVALLIMVFLSACMPSEDALINNTNDIVIRYIDNEAGVVCWMIYTSTRSGVAISCLPISDTKLGE